jgi:hypothetical protein
MRVDVASDHTTITVMACLWAAALIFAAVHWIRSRQPVVMLLFLAGGCMMAMEPMVDTVAACWFAANSKIAFIGWGRPMPVWLCLTYFVYFGVGSGVVWIAMQRGISRAGIWMFFVGEMAGDFVLETVILRTGLYTYYGHQPLLIGNFPLWWAPVNALVSVTCATLALYAARLLSGWRLLLVVPGSLCASAAANAAAGWPSWFVINSDVGPVWTQIGGLATVAIAGTVVYGITVLVARPAADAASRAVGRARVTTA